MITETLVLPYAPASAAVARAAVQNALDRHGVMPQRRDDAVLVVSELVGNSVRHARARQDGTLLVSLRLATDEIVVEVTDGGSGEPVMQASGHDSARPSGLRYACLPVCAATGSGRAAGCVLTARWIAHNTGSAISTSADSNLSGDGCQVASYMFGSGPIAPTST
jgi:hypothetical protein